jgi:hypothetical protein
MGKNLSGVHPDRSGSMSNRPAVDGKGKSSVSIRDTAEGKRVMKEGSRDPYNNSGKREEHE